MINKRNLLRLALILSSIIVISIKYNNYDIIVTALMLFGVVIEFIKTEESKIEPITTLIFWLSYVGIIYYWKKLNVVDSPLIHLELIKTVVFSFILLKIEKNNIQNSIFSKFWIVVLFIFLSEIALNSTFGFYGIYLISAMISILFTIINTYWLNYQKG
jgi:hypothetical protein